MVQARIISKYLKRSGVPYSRDISNRTTYIMRSSSISSLCLLSGIPSSLALVGGYPCRPSPPLLQQQQISWCRCCCCSHQTATKRSTTSSRWVQRQPFTTTTTSISTFTTSTTTSTMTTDSALQAALSATSPSATPQKDEEEDTSSQQQQFPFPRFYPIGIPGQPWTIQDEEEWKNTIAKFQRSYLKQVVDPILHQLDLTSWGAIIEQYGALSHNPERYPLYAIRSEPWNPTLPNVLITGGVHGYETSGVQGALLFLQSNIVAQYMDKFNFVVVPCVSPWSYEYSQRWQADLKDPNRSFFPNKPEAQTEESQALMHYLFHQLPSAVLGQPALDDDQDNNDQDETSSTTTAQPLTTTTMPTTTLHWTCHLDLHETTDSDSTEFRPAKFAKDGLPYDGDHIPDGFYLVGNVIRRNPPPSVDDDGENEETSMTKKNMDFLRAIIDRVRTVTHIAPTDDRGNLVLNMPAVDDGICLLPMSAIGLCGGVTAGTYLVTTEVYPDSPTGQVTDEICNQAQVAAITGALDYISSSFPTVEE